jgi:hypothetical protein
MPQFVGRERWRHNPRRLDQNSSGEAGEKQHK